MAGGGRAHAGAVTIVAHDVGTPGGMERQLAELAGGLLDRGWRVTIIARECRLPPCPGLRWVRVRGPARPFALGYLLFFLLGTLAVGRHASGLVHTTGAIVANRAALTTVHFFHRAFPGGHAGARASRQTPLYRLNAAATSVLSRAAEHACYRPSRTGLLVAVSNGLARELDRAVPGARVRVVPNGVDRDEFRPDRARRAEVRRSLHIGDEDRVAVFVGGDWERKGLRFAVEGVAITPDWHLVVVGPGNAEAYARLARDRGAPGRVHFAGPVSETAPWYAAADALVLPTLYEAFPLVALEAAAAGLALVATCVNGVEDILIAGKNGWFVTRQAESIAEALGRLSRPPDRLASFGRASRAASEAYGWDRAVDGYVAIYEEILRERSDRRSA